MVEVNLDFFHNCEKSCRRIAEYVSCRKGESSMRSLLRTTMHDVQFLHDLPLKTLNDRLRKYPFVDPKPFDELMAEMIDAVTDWITLVTTPHFVVDVLHKIGSTSQKQRLLMAAASDLETFSRREAAKAMAAKAATDAGSVRSRKQADLGLDEDIELSQLGRFVYPIPLKLRDLQDLVRPFMEVQSSHNVPGLDHIIQELVRSLLRIYYSVRAWDGVFVHCVEAIADAYASGNSVERLNCTLELCATMEMDSFEAAYRLGCVDGAVFVMSPGEIEIVCQRLPLYQDRKLLQGSPTMHLEHGGVASGGVMAQSGKVSGFAGENVFAEGGHIMEIRKEALNWWDNEQFARAAPIGVLSSTILNQLVDAGLHPDTYTTEMFPRTLFRLFGEQLSCQAFMCRLVPKLGGFCDTSGKEVPVGAGFTISSDPARAAEALLVFIRNWAHLVEAFPQDQCAEQLQQHINPGRVSVQRHKSLAKRGSLWNNNAFLEDMMSTGHSVNDVQDLLEGAKPIPDHVLQVPQVEGRYSIDEDKRRSWELITSQDYDTFEALDRNHRDLGPYLNLNIADINAVKQAWGNHSSDTWCLINPEIVAGVNKSWRPPGEPEEPNLSSISPRRARLSKIGPKSISDALGLKLVQFPPEWGSNNSTSTFVRFLSEDDRAISRKCLPGLPSLPWSFGTDERNAMIIDTPDPSIAPFHCVFVEAPSQPWRASVIPLGDPMSITHIICPKYQPLQIRNGDRLICQQWSFELRIQKTGLHISTLSILTDEGTEFEVPMEGCHVGAGTSSRQLPYQPAFPKKKFALNHRLKDMAPVHIAFYYQMSLDRWTLVDHSPDPFGTLLALRTGVSYPLSEGLRIKMGAMVLEIVLDKV